MKIGRLEISTEAVQAFCAKWKIVEFALFGSVLTDQFRPDSDVDVMVHFGPGGGQTPENVFEIRAELSTLFGGREVDFLERRHITNPYIRHHAITHRQVIYAA